MQNLPLSSGETTSSLISRPNSQYTTHNTQRTTHNVQHTTYNTQRTTHNAEHPTRNTQHPTLNTLFLTHPGFYNQIKDLGKIFPSQEGNYLLSNFNTQFATHNTQHSTPSSKHTPDFITKSKIWVKSSPLKRGLFNCAIIENMPR